MTTPAVALKIRPLCLQRSVNGIVASMVAVTLATSASVIAAGVANAVTKVSERAHKQTPKVAQ